MTDLRPEIESLRQENAPRHGRVAICAPPYGLLAALGRAASICS